jgi:acid phosphatase (class A)
MPHLAYIAIPALAVAAITAVSINRGISGRPNADRPESAGKTRSYLLPNKLPDALSFIPRFPAAGSPELKRDLDVRAAALKLYATPRYAVAVSDAHRDHHPTVNAFVCAFGTGISEKRTPALYKLLANVRLDVRASAYKAKARFPRQPPFIHYKSRTCSAEDEALNSRSSYPDARAAVGWAFGLILAELNPGRAEQLMQRAREFGRSRLICDAAWQSDVDAGISLAKHDVVLLRQDQNFRRDLIAAKGELAAELHSGVKPPLDCATEAVALAKR